MEEPIDHGIYSKKPKHSIKKLLKNDFRSDQIYFVPNHVELVRNNFVYKKIAYQDISEIHFSDGYLINNRWIIRLASIITIIITTRYILYGLTLSGGITQMNSAQWLNKGSLLSVWGPILLITLSLLAIYQSFMKSLICKLNTNKSKYKVRIRTLEKERGINELLQFLEEKEVSIIDERKKA